MLNIIPAHPQMASMIDIQPIQFFSDQGFTAEGLATAINAGVAFALTDGTRLLAIGGIAEMPDFGSRGLIWGVMAKGVKTHMTSIHRMVTRTLNASPCERIEAHILAEHVEGCRWIEMLGFKLETPKPMKKFWRGHDCWLYARIGG